MTVEEAIKSLLKKVEKNKTEEEKVKVIENFALNFEHQRRLEKNIKESFFNSIVQPTTRFREKHYKKISNKEHQDLITKKRSRSEKFRYLHNNLDFILDCLEKNLSCDKISTELIRTKRPKKDLQPSRQNIYNFLKDMKISTPKENRRNNTNDNK
jgi:hypothetical protein